MGLVALVLGLTGFGAFGIHRFLMGNKNAGILTILISFLTCGIGAVVMTGISIAEGLIYLTMTDEKFYQVYVIGRKEWL